NIQATVFLDQDSAVAESYDVVGVPTFYLIDSDGVVRGVDHSLPGNYEEILAAPAKK
ncbi:MAG: redoxin domain-containing protein, partial [Candidatus Omnitrophica bacterium]|nr:redoxin domain-containing protein [Candidatus Omnitrophota bacterium]